MFDWFSDLFKSKPKATIATPAPPKPAPAPTWTPKPKPDGLNVDYCNQLRRFGTGVTTAAPDQDMIKDLIEWGYLIHKNGSYVPSEEARRVASEWQPEPDPRIDN